MFIFRFAAVATAALAFTVPTRVQAQAGSEAVPSDVVRAILRNVDARSHISAIHLGGRVPDTLRSRIGLPPGARLIATLIGTPSYIIGTVRWDPDSVRLWFAEEFERRHYEPATWSRGQPAFRPAERSPSNSGYCDGPTNFSVSATSRTADSVEFLVRIRSGYECAPERTYATSGTIIVGRGPAELPLLHHPLTAEVRPECVSSARLTSGSARTDATIATTSAPEAVIAHYGRQLDTLGWQRDTSFTAAFGSWTRSDSAGTNLRVVLSIESAPGGRNCRSVNMLLREDPQ